MAVVSRRRYVIAVLLLGLLLWAVCSTSIWTPKDAPLQIGDGPLIVFDKPRSTVNSSGHTAKKWSNSLQEIVNMDTEMEARLSHMRQACARMKLLPRPSHDRVYSHETVRHLIYSTKKRIMYCYLPKVANTNFRRVFLGLEEVVSQDKVPDVSGYEVYFILKDNFKYLNQVPLTERKDMFKEFKTFLIVRDPLERLLSGYRNKFFHPNKNHQAEYHTRYQQFYEKHPSLKKLRNVRTKFTSGPLTFQEFVAYFIDSFETETYLNEHFVPSYLLCNPCQVNFDYIGKYETLDRDANYIFRKLNVDIPFPGRNDNYSAISTESLARRYFEPLPESLLQKLLDIFRPDYLLFGYSVPSWYKGNV